MLGNRVVGLVKDQKALNYYVLQAIFLPHNLFQTYLLPEQSTAAIVTATRIRVHTVASTAEPYAMSPRSGTAHGIRLTFMHTPRFSVVPV